MSLPRIIHFAWTGLPGQPAPEMPEWAKFNIEEFRRLNPEYEIRMHGEEAVLPKYREMYDRSTTYAHTSDLLRYSILQAEGGWWFDVDVYPFRPVRDIESAYGLDGKLLFVTEQHGQLSTHLTHNGAMMAAGLDCAAWPAVDAALAALPKPPPRVATGPELLTGLVKSRPELFEVGAWPFFYPAEIGRAGRLFEMFREMGNSKARRIAPTGGQLPFVMHLWSAEKPNLKAARAVGMFGQYQGAADAPFTGKYARVAPNQVQWEISAVCKPAFEAIVKGLNKIGFTVDVVNCTSVKDAGLYDLVVLWNGRSGQHAALAEVTRKERIPTLHLELGFFERDKYWQCDHAGILHWASWASELKTPSPFDGETRLRRVWKEELRVFRPHRSGYVLVLGQVQGDSQMDESELNEVVPLTKIVARTVGNQIPAFFRRHPKSRVIRKQYLDECQEPTLERAVEGARFVVTINSNAGNECMAWGCPVLCFGPALYGMAGVAKQTSVATFARDFDSMMAGWKPDPEEVRNYLEWLACRQWNAEEWSEGTALEMLVKRAGLSPHPVEEVALA